MIHFLVYNILFCLCITSVLIVMFFVVRVFCFDLPCISCGWAPILYFLIYRIFFLLSLEEKCQIAITICDYKTFATNIYN